MVSASYIAIVFFNITTFDFTIIVTKKLLQYLES